LLFVPLSENHETKSGGSSVKSECRKGFQGLQPRDSLNVKVIIEQDEDGLFVVTCPSLPGCISQGGTEEEALRNIKEAIELHLQCLSEDGISLTRDSEKKEMMISVNP
jgi:predicted RNase H-like HicB family nuclease